MYIYFNKELVATFIVLFLPTTKKMIFEGRYSYKRITCIRDMIMTCFDFTCKLHWPIFITLLVKIKFYS